METNLIIKGGEKELDLFFKAESYYNSVLAKMWEVKENNKIEMLLRHAEKFPFPRVNKKGKTTYSIDELISSMEKYDPTKKYIDLSKKQDFISAYENYKNEKKQKIQEQVSEIDYSEKMDYLKKQIKYLGFGKNQQLYEKLENAIKSPENEFSISIDSNKTIKGNQAKFELFFKKTEDGGVFFNSYKAKLLTNKGDIRSHTFQTQYNITAKESINLLEGRAIKINRAVKNKETQEIYKEPAFIKFKLNEEKNDYGNYKIEMFIKNYGVDVDKIMEKSNLYYFDDTHKDNVKKNLERGNITPVYFAEKENSKKEEAKKGFAILNIQYKMLNLYDEKMNRINSNSASQQLELADNKKKKIPQQNLNRGI